MAHETDGSLFTRKQLATIFDKDTRTIARWIADGLPVAVPGGKGGRPARYRLPDVMQWVIDRELQARGADGPEVSPSIERAKLDRKRREEIELRLRVRRRELATIEAVRQERAEIAAVVTARMRAVPDSGVADQVAGLPPAAVKVLLLAKIDEALRELARRGRETDGAAGGASSGPSSIVP